MKECLLTTLRDKKTDTAAFRQAADRLSELIAADIAAEMPKDPVSIETPLGSAKGFKPMHKIVLIPILRAGIALLPAFLKLFPDARVGFLGIKRDEKTVQSNQYYEKLPSLSADDIVIVLDPMIATGGTALLALEKLSEKKVHPSRIFFAGIIGSSEGIQRVKSKFPYVNLRIVGEDSQLNDRKFIVPGLGDFGDRYFS